MFQSAFSVNEYIEQKSKKEPLNYRTQEDLEFERERAKLDAKVKKMLDTKVQEFSFEIKQEKRHFKEVDDIQDMIDKAEESYRLFKRTGRMKEAKVIKQKLVEAKYAKEHLILVMNMDFSKPTARMQEMARVNKIDLKDPMVLKEFKKI